jgi:hypothetical protein
MKPQTVHKNRPAGTGPKRSKPVPCKTCTKLETKTCELCEQKGRDKIANTHCMNCCIFCPGCDRKGHQLYNEDGSYQCFKMLICGICTEKGHDEGHCRRDWCTICRSDGLGDNFVGHSEERCFKQHVCQTCNETGHMETRCPTLACKKCGNARHTTEQCEKDVRCNVCDQFGHSQKRCKKCFTCGFPKIDGKPHRCRRTEYNECKECDSVGTGRCPCVQYLWK